jgi:branched-chain amino acid transport system substrate-binding protein
MRSRFWKALATGSFVAVAVTSLGLAGCGSQGASVNKALIIATSLAVSGSDASAQLPAEYGVNLAVSQNQNLGNGYTLSVINKDYEGQSGPDANIGQADITALQNNAQVMAVVGPFNSGVAKQEIPVANAGGGPVLISPTNTNPGLTLQQYATEAGVNFSQLHPAGKPDYYFRIPANDYLQGKADAQIALQAPQILAKTAFVVDDNTTYGKPLADFFTQFFTAGGGTTVGTRTSITADTLSVLPQVAAAIKAAKPDVVFYGGLTSQGGCKLKKALVGAGYTKAMVGGDGIADDSGCLADAGPAAVGLVGTIAAPDPSTLTGSAVTTFKAAYTTFTTGKPNNDFTPYAAQSYDAAMIEINAIKGLITAGKAVTRSAVRDAVAATQYSGLVGNISFDQNGDNAGAKIFSVYAVLPGTSAWAYQTEITF